MPAVSASVHLLWRTALTLLLAWLAARACVALGTPIPWMIGPLLATAGASMAGLPTYSANALRNAGQWTIGAALGLYFTPEVTRLVASLWWAVALGVAWALALGLGFGTWLDRALRGQLAHLAPAERRATTYFAGAIGGASEMTLLAERAGARTDLVAAAHSVRMAVVVLSIPFAMQWAKQHWGLQALDMTPPTARAAEWPGLLWLVAGTAAMPAPLLWAGLARRLGDAPALALNLALQVTATALPAFASGPALLVLAAACLGLGFAGTPALVLSLASRLPARAGWQPVATVTAAYGVGQLLGPLLAGVLRQTSGSFALPSLVAALALLPALLFIPAATGYRLPVLFGRAAIRPR